MSQPYVGELRLVGFNFQPQGWNLCDGAIIAISQNTTLFQLLGTNFGGDGQNTFALPDLQGRIPLHPGPGYVFSQKAGAETVTLSLNQYPQHTHGVLGTSNAGNSVDPTGSFVAADQTIYAPGTPPPSTAAMNTQALDFSGNNLPHDNMQPYLVLNWIIALFGVFPSQN